MCLVLLGRGRVAREKLIDMVVRLFLGVLEDLVMGCRGVFGEAFLLRHILVRVVTLLEEAEEEIVEEEEEEEKVVVSRNIAERCRAEGQSFE